MSYTRRRKERPDEFREWGVGVGEQVTEVIAHSIVESPVLLNISRWGPELSLHHCTHWRNPRREWGSSWKSKTLSL